MCPFLTFVSFSHVSPSHVCPLLTFVSFSHVSPSHHCHTQLPLPRRRLCHASLVSHSFTSYLYLSYLYPQSFFYFLATRVAGYLWRDPGRPLHHAQLQRRRWHSEGDRSIARRRVPPRGCHLLIVTRFNCGYGSGTCPWTWTWTWTCTCVRVWILCTKPACLDIMHQPNLLRSHAVLIYPDAVLQPTTCWVCVWLSMSG
jgi:hypothetical protein